MANNIFATEEEEEKVVGELTVGHEIMTHLHSLLLQEPTCFKVDRVRGDELSCNLSRVLKAFEVGISILKHDLDSADESQDSANSSSPYKKRSKITCGNSDARNQKMRKCANSRTIASYSPFGDGYQWRKYGEKKIQNGAHSRTYYRCTNTGCSARKQVQQKESSGSTDMPLYDITYNHDHTCGLAPDFATLSLVMPTLSSSKSQILSFDWNTNKQEHEHLRSFQKSSCTEQILSPQSTDIGLSSVNLFPTDQTVAESTSENDHQIDIYNCSSPEGPWFGFDTSAYT